MSSKPPGPRGEPLFGSSRTYADDPFRFIHALEDAYGPVAQFQMGPMETVMLTDPPAIEQVLVSEADRFRKPDFQDDALGDLLGDGLLLSEGETWQRQRELANPAFRMSRIAGFDDRIVGHAEDMLADWSEGETVDAERAMTRVTLNVILDLMMGVELPEERIDTIETQLEPLGRRFEPDPIRFAMPDFVPMPDDEEFESSVATLEGVIDDIIGMRRGSFDTDGDAGAPMDFLSLLMRARGRGEQSDAQIRDEMMTMLLAGHDTTALTLTYAWFLLSEHPEARQRVEAEIDDVVGDDDPSMDHVCEFDYLEWVINESMRLYPPVFTIFRTPTEDVELAGYEVPAETTIMLPQYGVHRSERLYENPEEFDPERWRPERREQRHRFAFFPFGGGPRHCIGKHLALLEAKLIMARTASDYRLDFEGETPLTLQPSLTMHPQQEMTMTVRERS